jgi:hypothetical protein
VETDAMKWFAFALLSLALPSCASTSNLEWQRADGRSISGSPDVQTQFHASLLNCTAQAQEKYPIKLGELSSGALKDAAEDFNRTSMIEKCMAVEGYKPKGS